MKKLFLSFMLLLATTFTFAQSTWSVDPMHSSFNFNIKHMGISFVQGRFDKFDGSILTPGVDLKDAKFDFTIDVASIDTDVEPRDNHLKSADFFDVEKFPKMTFKSTTVNKAKGNAYVVAGDLTIKGVTKPIVVTLTYGGKNKDQQGNEKMGIQTNFKINRFDYGISYDPSGTALGKNVDISVFAELTKK
ncbi:YceI family protein [Soonwooa purpurea]